MFARDESVRVQCVQYFAALLASSPNQQFAVHREPNPINDNFNSKAPEIESNKTIFAGADACVRQTFWTPD